MNEQANVCINERTFSECLCGILRLHPSVIFLLIIHFEVIQLRYSLHIPPC